MTDQEQDIPDDFEDMDAPVDVDTIAESENYAVWQTLEPDQEVTYHIDIENVTLHFYQEEWDEYVGLMQKVVARFGKSTPKAADKGNDKAQGKKKKK